MKPYNLYSSFKRNIINRNYNSESNNSSYKGKNTFTNEVTNISINTKNIFLNTEYKDSNDEVKESEYKIEKTKYFNKYYNNSLKKSILFNLKPIKNLSNSNKKKTDYNNNNKKLILKPTLIPFNKIKFLNIKKISIKDNVMSLLSNYNLNLNKGFVRNRTSVFEIDKNNFKLSKPNSLKELYSRHLKLKKNFSCFNINFFNDYEKDFFPEIDYSNLEYNEYEIYKDKSIYENIIKEKINYFKNNNNENFTTELMKEFHYGKHKKQINLTLNSLIITLEDMQASQKVSNTGLKINFPFALLPIFYFKGIDSFQKFLAMVMKVENNFEKIIFDNNLISVALNHLKDYQVESNENIKDKNMDLNKNLEYNNLSYKRERKSNLKEIKSISLRPLNLQRDKNFLNFNSFIFFWITNIRNYIVKLNLPCITLKIPEFNITINHYLDFEFLFFLYKNNFNNWEYYVIKYLSSYSKFRNIFQQLGSHMKISNKIIFLKEPKAKVNTFELETLYNIYTDQYYKNHIILFKSFYVNIEYIDENYLYEKLYNIYFSFSQYIKLYEIAKYAPKIDFLIKFLEINNDTHTLNFNFKEYDSFDIKSWMNNMKKFSGKSLSETHDCEEEKLFGVYDIYKKKIKIKFNKPQWTIIKFENGKEINKTWEIGKELETDLVLSILYGGTETWTNLLNKCLKKLNEIVPDLPKTSLPNIIKRHHSKKKHEHKYYSKRSSFSSKGRIVRKKTYN